MAASSDLIECCICLEKYNDSDRMPKDLTCLHTVCFTCIEKIFKNNTIKCPICRRKTRCVEVEQLNTNTNALLAEIESQRPSKKRMTREKKKISNQAIDRALQLSQKSLEELIEKRQKIKTHSEATLTSLRVIQQEVEKTVKENNVQITRLKRKLRRHKMIKAETEEFESATTKCRKLTEECSTELKSIAKFNIDWENKLNVDISLETLDGLEVTSSPAFDECFRLNTVSDDHKKSLLSHLIFSVITQHGATFEVEPDSDVATYSDQSYDSWYESDDDDITGNESDDDDLTGNESDDDDITSNESDDDNQ